MTRLIIATTLVFVALGISAQTYSLKGKVQDTANKNLIGAVTVALNPVEQLPSDLYWIWYHPTINRSKRK